MWRNTAAIMIWADHRWMLRRANPNWMSCMIVLIEA